MEMSSTPTAYSMENGFNDFSEFLFFADEKLLTSKQYGLDFCLYELQCLFDSREKQTNKLLNNISKQIFLNCTHPSSECARVYIYVFFWLFVTSSFFLSVFVIVNNNNSHKNCFRHIDVVAVVFLDYFDTYSNVCLLDFWFHTDSLKIHLDI